MDQETEVAVIIERLKRIEASIEEGRMDHRQLWDRLTEVEKKMAASTGWFLGAVAVIQFLMGSGWFSLRTVLEK
jgi:hypothetical protein